MNTHQTFHDSGPIYIIYIIYIYKMVVNLDFVIYPISQISHKYYFIFEIIRNRKVIFVRLGNIR